MLGLHTAAEQADRHVKEEASPISEVKQHLEARAH